VNSLFQRTARTISIKSLEPAKDIEMRDEVPWALSADCWFRVNFDELPPSGRWIRLKYASSFLDQLARPMVRFFVGDRHYDEILPGPLLGRAIWFGRAPPGVAEMWISPTGLQGPFKFSLEEIAVVPTGEIMLRCLRAKPFGFVKGGAAGLIGLRQAAYREFRQALSCSQTESCDEWRETRSRRLELTGLDAPRSDWRDGPHIRLICADSTDAADISALLSQLRSQPYPHWSIAVVSTCADKSPELVAAEVEERLLVLRLDASATEALKGLSNEDFIVPIAKGDSMPEYALAALAEVSRQNGDASVFYGDREHISSGSRPDHFLLRPDWSPAFFSACAYTLGAQFIRMEVVGTRLSGRTAHDLLNPMQIFAGIRDDKHLTVHHIRRVMVRSRLAAPPQGGRSAPKVSLKSGGWAGSGPRGSVIIPTRDRTDLLQACITSLKESMLSHQIEVIVVDNGSRQEKSRRFLSQLAQDNRIRVISRPGPFNFSKLCNDAAYEATASTLVFLNNDTQAMGDDWLGPLFHWAQQSDVGAVGAKLLYPNGRLQHAEVVLGLDGLAGHFERTLSKDDPGYFGRLCVPHEVSAVTAACLAVDKSKFQAIGGFDAVNLPVDLGDIDLCLRLSERGWKTICAPDSVLIHRESASRGKKLRAEEVYRKERDYFRSRWIHRLRDDPFFHPALSLDRHEAILD
jgi:O-antigen biosynthesis protein